MEHFPPESVEPYDIEVLSPDEFLVHQFHLDKELLLEKLHVQAAAARIPVPDLLARLGRWAPGFSRLAAELC